MSDEKTVSGETTVEKRPHVPRDQFMTVWEASDSAKQVAEKLGIKASSALARASKLRGEGITLKNMKRGGGVKLTVESGQELLAKLRGCTVEEIRKEAAQRAAEKTSA